MRPASTSAFPVVSRQFADKTTKWCNCAYGVDPVSNVEQRRQLSNDRAACNGTQNT
jgi:hypothetical protein